jgi:hypothetical protein
LTFTNIFDINHVNGTSIDLGAGDDTDVFGGIFATFAAVGVEHINGTATNNGVTLTNNVNGIAIDLGDGFDSVQLANGANSLSIVGVENLNASDFGGAPSDDVVTASAGHDNFRFASIADSAAGAADTINNFDAANDSFTFSGIAVTSGHIEYIDSGSFGALGQASAYLQNNGPGNDILHVDTNGDGTSDMDISLQNFTGTLQNNNFLLT